MKDGNNPINKAPLRTPLVLALTAIMLVVTLLATQRAAAADDPPPLPLDPSDVEPYKFDPVSLPRKTCFGSNLQNCQFSSPALADVNEDGFLDIILGTNNGHVVVVKHNGQILWDRDVTDYIAGMGPNSNEIHSSPAVADIDQDGNLEIVVGMGTIRPEVCTQGGVIVLDRFGNAKPGWPQLTTDWAVPPAGCRDTVFSSPVLGDMDNDGDLEIVVGSFDMRIYAWHHDGTLLPGFPPDSWLYQRFNWGIFQGHLADTVWASPALADVNGDGYLDIVTSTDEGNQGDGWTCPYALPPGWRTGYCGGSIYALDRFGQILEPHFPIHFLETVQATVAIADLDGDAEPDIIVGSGTFYRNNSPDRPTYGFKVHALDMQGNALPGWQGGKDVGGPVPASPVVGDIAGDNRPEVVVAVAEEKKLYAWHHDGSLVNGFPMTPLDLFGNQTASFNVGHSFLLADFDGDEKMEIFFNQGWVVTIVDGNGYQLTSPFYPNGDRPVYFTDGSLLNTPAVGDIDNDGKLELITHNSMLYVWDLENATAGAEWPMFKRNAAGNPVAPMPAFLDTASTEMILFKHINESGPVLTSITLRNLGDNPLQWEADPPGGVSLATSSGTLAGRSVQTINVSISRSGLSQGFNALGDIHITATSEGVTAAGSPLDISITVFLGNVSEALLPIIGR